MKNFDLRQKKVIDADTAEVIGYIQNMDIDFDSGTIQSVTVPKRGMLGIFGMGKSVTVPWERVLAMGSEYVIVKTRPDIK
ncbi:MAG: YlmC/YmxH family sporulation protein [Ruminococcaceae bacterium]|nr:YlmC/YmxH family sporulation protein [Oscillospiraceae bacterium]